MNRDSMIITFSILHQRHSHVHRHARITHLCECPWETGCRCSPAGSCLHARPPCSTSRKADCPPANTNARQRAYEKKTGMTILHHDIHTSLGTIVQAASLRSGAALTAASRLALVTRNDLSFHHARAVAHKRKRTSCRRGTESGAAKCKRSGQEGRRNSACTAPPATPCLFVSRQRQSVAEQAPGGPRRPRGGNAQSSACRWADDNAQNGACRWARNALCPWPHSPHSWLLGRPLQLE